MFPISVLLISSLTIIFQSPFSGDFLCFEMRTPRYLSAGNLSISIFRRLSLFRRAVGFENRPGESRLSISIFRRLSLFQEPIHLIFTIKKLSISIFRRLSLFPPAPSRAVVRVSNFQSPFSGDFLCFSGYLSGLPQYGQCSFNLHFQETFFVSKQQK